MNDWAALAGASVGVAVAKSTAEAPHIKGGVLLLRENMGMEAIPLLLRVASETQSVIFQVRTSIHACMPGFIIRQTHV
jgi:cation transport ATPase